MSSTGKLESHFVWGRGTGSLSERRVRDTVGLGVCFLLNGTTIADYCIRALLWS